MLAGSARAVEIAPPWCGTPEPDAAGSLPDGSSPTHPPGSFPHIPYYAIGCTLDKIKAESRDGRMKVEVFGRSAQGRPMYLVTINQTKTKAQREAFENWQEVRELALEKPDKALKRLSKKKDDFKVPIFIQSAIHGNEYEGVDAMMQFINRVATTRYGTDPEVDRILDHAILVFNVVQNPDGRAAGTRANGNGFDLNRDFLTQSQPEVQAVVSVLQKWLFPDMLDQHGYVTPTLIEATTKPHNPGIDYDLFLKWNQPRTAANVAALATVGLGAQRPINDWCSDADLPPIGSTVCADGNPPGPAVAEGWDDWGPFYTPMYNQLVGLNGSTVEMCSSTATNPNTQRVCGAPGLTTFPVGRAAARLAQEMVTRSTLAFDIANRKQLLADMIEIYRRGDDGAKRPDCCPPPFDVANNWMHEYPTAYVIPRGAGQRSDAEANRLVSWLLTNGVEVTELEKSALVNGQRFDEGSYVVWMDQPHRGLAETALSVGVDVSDEIGVLYAPPAAWSHGYLWGADIVQIPAGTRLHVKTEPIKKPGRLDGGVENGSKTTHYALRLNSPTAVRTLNRLLGDGVPAQIATQPITRSGRTYPAGSAIFDASLKKQLERAGRDSGLTFEAVSGGQISGLEPLARVPRFAVLANGLTQEIWVLRNLGFTADPIPTGAGGDLNNPSAPNPLEGYDVVYNQANWPGGATARARLTEFFAAGGGYIGAGTNGAAFLTNSGQVAGLTAANRGGGGRSGIVYWDNVGGAASPIVGAYPARDTAIMDPPTWLTAVPASFSVDARLPSSGFFAAGLWLLDAQSASAPGSALVAHGPNATGTARLTVFAFNPLYRADPEREWPAVASAAYWAGRRAAGAAPAPEPLMQEVKAVDVPPDETYRRGR
ncbi:MAG TPA: M14 family zinc carboxypeptidase [Solirubrobacter sp.]|nr:M14 family zinc carboxypeptidase [Solirubrobacter sp.]